MFGGFVKPTAKVIKKRGPYPNILETLQQVANRDVLIGIPQEQSSRGDEGPNNAELAYLHTEGSPANRIPARPFLQPSIWAHKEEIALRQKKLIKDALAGNAELVKADMIKIGLYGQKVAKEWFKNPANNWAPNAPVTIARKGSDSPLIDTGALRQSITYVVREDKRQ